MAVLVVLVSVSKVVRRYYRFYHQLIWSLYNNMHTHSVIDRRNGHFFMSSFQFTVRIFDNFSSSSLPLASANEFNGIGWKPLTCSCSFTYYSIAVWWCLGAKPENVSRLCNENFSSSSLPRASANEFNGFDGSLSYASCNFTYSSIAVCSIGAKPKNV
jgi:hypothetical protein